MIVDSSAIMAIVLREPEHPIFLRLMANAPVRRLSAGTWIELAAVAVGGKLMATDWLDRALAEYELIIEPVTAEQALIGHAAYRRYGVGSGHRARLNFGDCFAYALAKATGEPLLFKGDDFTHTDTRKVGGENGGVLA